MTSIKHQIIHKDTARVGAVGDQTHQVQPHCPACTRRCSLCDAHYTAHTMNAHGPQLAQTGGHVDERELRRLCRRLLQDLDVTPPLDAMLLCERLSTVRGRPIKLKPTSTLRGGTFASLIPMPTRDLIIYQATTSHAGQLHLIFHELLHLLLGHLAGPDDDPLLCGSFLVDGNTSGDGHTLYDPLHEWEAETGATILSGWASSFPARDVLDHTDDPVARRLDLALGDTRSWR